VAAIRTTVVMSKLRFLVSGTPPDITAIRRSSRHTRNLLCHF
jgi:hypothetical protein